MKLRFIFRLTTFLFGLGFALATPGIAQSATCFSPGNLVVTDAPDLTILAQHDIERVYAAEPFFGDGSEKLVFSIDVRHLRLDLPILSLPLGTWNVIFTNSAGTSRYVRMSTLLGNPRFTYGTVTNLLGIPIFNHQGDIQGNYAANGRITLVVSKNLVGNPANGTQLTIAARTFIITLGIGLLQADQSGSSTYIVQGTGSCTPFQFSHWGTNGDVPVTNDYTRNGTNDFAVWRPDSGDWYTQDSVTGDVNVQNLGSGTFGDIAVPGDYDNDGRGDFAVYRPSTGTWFIYHTETSETVAVRFGIAEDIPLAGDFDGDRVDDVVVYRPSSGTWFILNSLDSTVRFENFGLSEDRPFAGDLDGDRRADVGVFRPSSGVWYGRNSNDNSLIVVHFGLGTDVITPADYDGDGRTDISVWRPETGFWYRLESNDGSFAAINWGLSTDRVQPGDYNGNGRADLAVWRPETGDWFVYFN